MPSFASQGVVAYVFDSQGVVAYVYCHQLESFSLPVKDLPLPKSPPHPPLSSQLIFISLVLLWATLQDCSP